MVNARFRSVVWRRGFSSWATTPREFFEVCRYWWSSDTRIRSNPTSTSFRPPQGPYSKMSWLRQPTGRATPQELMFALVASQPRSRFEFSARLFVAAEPVKEIAPERSAAGDRS